MTRLILFDIDGTLVLSGGAGARAMTQAFESVFGQGAADAQSGLGSVPMAGRTDTWIIKEMSRLCGFTADAPSVGRFQQAYLINLAREIDFPGPRKGVLPGVRNLLDALSARPEVSLALLTGNFAAGARIKLEHFDLWRYFPCGAFAEDGPDRNSLFAHAVACVEANTGQALQPPEVVVIGDTPHDIEVARVAGARSVGVATGSFDRAALLSSGAEVALEDLSDLPAVLAAFGLDGRGPARAMMRAGWE